MTTRLILVTGHTFGRRAYEGIFSSAVYLDGQLEVPLMIGLPADKAESTVGYAAVDDLAREQGAEFVTADDGSLLSLAGTIKDCAPHYILVIGWSRLVHKDVLRLASVPGSEHADPSADRRAGCIGMHPTKLPAGRGQAPIPWTIIKRLHTTALSVFFLEPDADTGPVIARHDLPVRRGETSASLFYRIAATHFTAGFELAPALADRAVPGRPQEDDRATRWPKRRPPDSRLDHSMTYEQIDTLVRAQLGPYPRAFVTIDGQDYAVRAAWRASDDTSATSVDEVRSDVIRFGCADGVVLLTRDVSR